MIARIWTARASAANAPRYAAHLDAVLLPELHRLPGYRGAKLLERSQDGEVEIIVVTWWQSLDDVRAFAGHDLEHAVVSDEARALLASFDDRVRHFHVVVDDSVSA
jgi:heme-degrading monooxygenase HmoA